MKYQYTYVGDNPVDFPTLGIREVQKGDTVESDEPLFSLFLVEKDSKPTETKGE